MYNGGAEDGMTTKEDPVLKALLEVPEDDEPLSKDEEQAINAAKEEFRQGLSRRS